VSSDQPWFAVRCIFRHPLRVYEERVTLWRAESFEDAIKLAEEEAERYAKESDLEYLGFAQAFHLFADKLEPGAEIFSLLRGSELESEEYITRFFDTGDEAAQKT
jgi:hypothetical protein